jgi:hypothetical protein
MHEQERSNKMGDYEGSEPRSAWWYIFVGPKVRGASALRDFTTIQTIASMVSEISDKELRSELGRAIAPALQKSAQNIPKAVGDVVKGLAA